MSGVEEISGMIIGDCEREETRASPCDIVGVREFLNVLSKVSNTKNITERVK